MTRAVAVLLALACLTLGGAAVGMAVGVGAGPCGERALRIEAPGDAFEATFVGDTLLGDAAQPLLTTQGYDSVFTSLAGLTGDGFLMANAEGPITTLTTPFDAAQHWHYNAQPAAAGALQRGGIDAVSLANNHAMDRGPQGLADTIDALDAAGVASVGAGGTLCDAELPLLVETPVGTLGVVGLGKYYGREKMASLAGPGTIALSEAAIVRGATLARSAGADWIVAFVHWGRSYEDVTREQQDYARLFSEAGYDLVIGAHPHVSQRIEFIEGMPVVYSLGNFVFGAPGRFTVERPGTGLLVSARFVPTGVESLTIRCIVTDNEAVAFRPRACEPQMAAATLGALHDRVEVVDGVGRLAVP